MSKINREKFITWAETSFGDVVVSGDEVKVNSIFCEDYKHHLWCNVSGGKNKYDYGVYHCWKTDERGTLVKLVMSVDKCSFEEALEKLGVKSFDGDNIEEKLNDIMNGTVVSKETQKENNSLFKKLTIPEGCVLLSDLPENDYFKMNGESYLQERKIPTEKFFVGVGGEYVNRIIIPYYDEFGNLIYYNGRYMGKSNLKYMGPHKSVGVGKSEVLYFSGFNWPEEESLVYFTEGEFNSESLFSCGFESGAFGGKQVHETQINHIIRKKYTPVICFDNDDKKTLAGQKALIECARYMMLRGIRDIYYIKPPDGYKDWNDLLVGTNRKIVRSFVIKTIKKVDELELSNLMLSLGNI